MWRQAVLVGALMLPAVASARCFDFTQKVVGPLRDPPPLKEGAELGDFGTLRSGRVWTTVRRQVRKPIKRVFELLLDHDITKGAETDEAVATPVKNDTYLALQKVEFRTSPLPLINIRWTEEWAFALSKGTPTEPEEIVVSYEKTEGTRYIEHMCGSIVVRRISESTTDVFWFEEAKVSQRSAEDTRDTIAAIVKLLQDK